MCDKRTFNRELDLDSGQWEEAIRREVLSEVEKLFDEVEIKGSDGSGNGMIWKWQLVAKLNQLKGSDVR